MRRYYQRDIFICLRDRGPLRARQICEAVGIPLATNGDNKTKNVSQALLKLKRAGLVERDGYTWRAVKGKRPPTCRCGHSPNSKAVLREHSRHNAVAMNAKMGRHIRPVATTALEQAWGWLPSTSPRLRAQNDYGAISGGTVRPQETEAA